MVTNRGYISEIFVSFQGEGAHAGRRHLFVRLAGCNLRCTYCDTPGSLERTATCDLWIGDQRTVRENPIEAVELNRIIAEIRRSDGPIDAVAFTGGEPLMQADFLVAALRDRPADLPILLETNGVLPARLEPLVDLVDIVSMDLKLPSNTGEASFWHAHARFLAIAGRCELYVKIVVDERTTESDVDRATQLVNLWAPGVPVYLQPMTGSDGGVKIGPRRLTELYRIGRKNLESLWILPQTHKMMGLR